MTSLTTHTRIALFMTSFEKITHMRVQVKLGLLSNAWELG